MSTKKIANIAMLVALAIIFSYVEVLIPINIGIPGVKLGLANLVIVIALYSLDIGDVWLISLVRIVLVGFMFGSLMSIAYSLAGAIVSLIAMMIIKKTDFFGIMGVSIIGAVCHNMAQIAVAAFVVKNNGIYYYVPMLLIAGVITGGIIGVVSHRVLNILKKFFLLIFYYCIISKNKIFHYNISCLSYSTQKLIRCMKVFPARSINSAG